MTQEKKGGAIPNGADDSLKLLQLVDSLKRKPAKRHMRSVKGEA